MKMFLGTTLKSIVAAIMALLMPFISLVPTTPSYKPQSKPSTADQQIVDSIIADGEQTAPDFEELVVPDEEPAAPASENAQNDQAAEDADDSATRRDVQSATDRAGANNTYIAEWDISATEEDDVKMYYYEDESVFENITASIRSLFTLTAYAAEEDEEIAEEAEEAENTEETVVPVDQHVGGTVVIEGTGVTEKLLFTKWLNYDLFITDYEEFCDGYNISDDRYIPRAEMTDGDIFNIGRVSYEYIASQNEDLSAEEINQIVLDEYFPIYIFDFVYSTPDFWTTYASYMPTRVEINGNVSKISYGAFALYTQLTELEINAPVVEIDALAFMLTGIGPNLVLPESLRIIGDSAFASCLNLKEVYIKGTLEKAGYCVFMDIPNDANVYCRSYATFYKITHHEMPEMMMLGAGPEEDIGNGTMLVYNPDVFFEL